MQGRGVDSGADEEIPLPNVKSAVLKKVIEYCKHALESPPTEIEKPLKSANMQDVVADKWYAAYIEVEQDVLFELILAANYLDIKSLLELGCASVAAMMKGTRSSFNRRQNSRADPPALPHRKGLHARRRKPNHRRKQVG